MLVWCLGVDAAAFILVDFFFFFQAEDGIRDVAVTGVQTCALPICLHAKLGRPLARAPDSCRLGRAIRAVRAGLADEHPAKRRLLLPLSDHRVSLRLDGRCSMITTAGSRPRSPAKSATE